jgi:GT2 family glycosyltransferase
MNPIDRLAIVILNFNGRHFLEKFLPVVLEHHEGYPVIVADNASTDDSVAWLQAQYPQVRTIVLPQNTGYAGGYNEALRQVEAEYYVLLNSDVAVTENWIEPVLEQFDTWPRLAATQPKIRAYYQRNSFEYAGASGGFLDALGYPFCRGRVFDTLEVDQGQYNEPRQVFWATGACLFVRSAAFWEVGGFDADFFAHMEEIDFCWRLHHRGYDVAVCPQSTVYHVGGGTLPKSNPKKTFLNFRNSLAMLYKNAPEKNLFGRILLRLLLDGLAGVQFLLRRQWRDCWAIIQAHGSFYEQWGRWKQKRAAVQAAVVQADLSKVWYQGSIVKAYFFQKIRHFSDLHW